MANQLRRQSIQLDDLKNVSSEPVVGVPVSDTPAPASRWKWAALTVSGLSLLSALILFIVSVYYAERNATNIEEKDQFNEKSEQLATGVWISLVIAVLTLLVAQWV